MAAFGEDECMRSSLYDTIQGSQPLKRVEPSIQKFTKIVIPTDLERLRQHKVNIEKVILRSILKAETPSAL